MTEWTGGQAMDNFLAISKWSVVTLLCLFILAIVIISVLRVVNYYRKYKQDTVILEVTPPAFQDKRPDSTTQFLSVIHGLFKVRSVSDYILRYTPSFSFEILSTRNEGIRYLVHVDKKYQELMRQSLQAYLTDAKVKVLKDYPSSSGYTSVGIFKQSQHFAIPLDLNGSLDDHDPVSYLTNSMTKLEEGEQMSVKLVITPAAITEASRIDNKIRNGYWSGSSLHKLLSTKSIVSILWGIFKLPFQLVWYMLFSFFTNDIPSSSRSAGKYGQGYQAPPPAEQEFLDQMHGKLSQDLFYTDLRSYIVTKNKRSSKERGRALVNSFATYSTSHRQSLRPVNNWMPTRRLVNKVRSEVFFRNLPALIHRNSNIFSSEEIGSIFHFPHNRSARTENVVKSLSKTLPAPITLKNNELKLDVILGKNVHQGSETLIGLTKAERERHVYMIGGTGNGKTTVLQYAIKQDIAAGKGLAVIDPHGDMALTLLRHIPKDRIQDVIYFNPDDIDYPLAMNLLEIPEGLEGSALEREKDRVTESVISVLRKIFSTDDSGGHRIEYVLRNAIQTALTTKDPTIFTIFELLTNDTYRKKISNALPSGTLKNFWQNELGKAGAMQRIKMSHGVTSKIGRFEFSPATKRVMGRAKSTLDFDDILASGKILICNFSKGNLGEDTSELFGTAVLAKLQLAALRRARVDQAERKPFYLYVDEFQNFATMPFVQMLSEARKYKLFLMMAEQSTAQQDEQRLVQIILANVGTVITFRTGSPVDEQLVLPLFRPFIEEGEISNLPSFSFYARLSAIKSQEPMSGETLLIEDDGSEIIAKDALRTSRQLYAYEYTKMQPKSVKGKSNGAHSAKTKPVASAEEDTPVEV